MKSNSRIVKIDGIKQGEFLELMARSDGEFLLTVTEPDFYGERGQDASMALTRKQAKKIIKAMKAVLNEK